MESLVVIIAAILWTAGRYSIHTKAEWQGKSWFIKGLAITIAIVPATFFYHWDALVTSAFLSRNEIIACEISLRLFLIVMAIQSLMGIVFMVSSRKSGQK
ncbi:hypothetical protein BIZ37_26740 [Photobacterium sp. BZF1]|uniref:hypothetical protein n=1 Tax=Photobacterium TaxID=657 RepID=UPI0016536868|nr:MULTISPECIES: hypothetical protein [Photobacterium]MBC7006163.1 hypothetical protein [Photobacterium sp. BZF1]MBY5946270.1 hypothetical protein [Photobacterium rosenbergii]